MRPKTAVERVQAEWKGPLHAGTLDLHHYIEHETIVGAAMAAGKPARKHFVGWLCMKKALHDAIAPALPECCRRGHLYAKALQEMGAADNPPEAIMRYCFGLEGEQQTTGAAYVLIGGELMGGRVIAKRLADNAPQFPRSAFVWSPRDALDAMVVLRQYRMRADCILEARQCFAALIDSCEEFA